MSDLREEIVARYPQQFEGGDFFIGIAIDQGWKSIVLDACAEVQQRLTADELRRFHWVQIKEKFGGLRMYWGPDNIVSASIIGRTGVHSIEIESTDPPVFNKPTVLAIREIVARARERAGQTCEVCGAAGRLYPEGYWQTLCEHCAMKRGKVPATRA